MLACHALLLLALPFAHALLVPMQRAHDHHDIGGPLPGSWYHSDDHVVNNLFRRDAPTDGSSYPTVGSTAWSTPYPGGKIDVTKLPKVWTDALAAAVAAGKIPNIPVATIGSGADAEPTYAGVKATDPSVCSSTQQCYDAGDIHIAPDGVWGLGFDDGPQPPTTALMTFLAAQKQNAAHYLIGSNIIAYPNEFMAIFNAGDDLAVHTWTHPYMTTQTNLQVLGELGWTMQLIHNSTGGRVPKYWRPPYGDADNRVRAIATEIFGLTAVLWNQDTNDWMLGNGVGSSPTKVEAQMAKWITGAKSPGLIVLEHELSQASVNAFITSYPLMLSNGWTVKPSTQLADGTAYKNSPSSAGAVTPGGILVDGADFTGSNATTSASSGGGASASAAAATASSTPKKSAEIRSASVSRLGVAGVVLLSHCFAIAFFYGL